MKNFPLRVASIYLLFALIWIYASDALLEKSFSQPVINKIQSLKGAAFVMCTSFLLYLLLSHYNKVIQEKQQDYLKLFSENPNIMWVYATDSLYFLMANNMAIEKYGYTQEEFRKMRITDLLPKEASASDAAFFHHTADTRQSDSGVWEHRSKNDQSYFIHVYSHSTVFENKKARVVVGIDVTQKIKTEHKIKQQMGTLKEIAWIQSHELRKPLANIMGLVDLLKKQKNADTDNLFPYLEESCNELDSIVRKVVELSAMIERG